MQSDRPGSSSSSGSVGSYSVISEIGRGGMGVVLLAHDTRLDRRVALKAITPEFASEPERLARFSREARTLASLNHPNVAQVYGLEEQDGARYLVMEYVEGRSLADLLEAGPMAVDEALRLASQIAAGVEAAHEQGVIHRDLKPGNIVVTPEGKAKVLDFGLAREVESRGSTLNLSMSPTATLPNAAPTIEGQIIGTVAYMSPEQARGKALGKRTDVWSFGCVMYEMLTGTAPFTGETASDRIAAILEREPDWSTLPARTPRRIRELLIKCLEKDQSRRLRDIGDARLELEKSTTDREWTTQNMAAFEGAIRYPTRAKGWLFASGLLLVASALAAWGGWSLRAANSGEQDAVVAARFIKATDDEGLKIYPSLSPDGKTLIYTSGASGNFDIYRLRVGGFNPTNLTSNWTEDDYQPAISPDGEQIVFRSERDGGGLYVMGATGESPRRLTDFGFNPSWSPDGTKIVCATESILGSRTRLTQSKLWIVDVNSGEKRELPVVDGVQPDWSPGGARIAFWSVVGGGQRDLNSIAVDGAAPVAITNDPPTDWNPVWSPDGRFLYFCSDRSGVMGVWRIAVDETTGQVSGAPTPVTAGGSGDAAHLSTARNFPRIAYALESRLTQTWRLAIDPEAGLPVGEPELVTPGSYSTLRAEISPDGGWLVYTSSDGAHEDIFLVNTEDGQRRQLTNDPAKDRGPSWSPDGTRILFYSDRSGTEYGVWVMNRDGSGLKRISPAGARWVTPIWDGNGARVIANSDEGLHFLDPNASHTGQAPIPLLPQSGSSGTIYPITCSADSAWLLCAQGAPGGLGIYSMARKEMVWTELESAHGRFLAGSNRALVLTKTGLGVLDAETGKVEPSPHPQAPEELGWFSLTRDGKWAYFSRTRQDSDIWIIDLK